MKIKEIFSAERFYFLRHGESINNKNDLVNGWTDCSLTDTGREQARKAAIILKKEPISRIVTSDLQRALETAEIVASELNLPVEKYPELRERNWGIYENGPRSQRPGLHETPEKGEGPQEYYERVVNALQKVNIVNNTLIVGHAGTMRVLMTLLECKVEERRIPNTKPFLITLKNLEIFRLI